MPTITLTIDDALLGALVRGEAVQLTATLRAKKARAKKEGPVLTEDERMVYDNIRELCGDQGLDVGRAWPPIKALMAQHGMQDVLRALEVFADVCWPDRAKSLYYFAPDYAKWRDLAALEPMEYEAAIARMAR
jgi:hypothetical protein